MEVSTLTLAEVKFGHLGGANVTLHPERAVV
jgi:hypothetical protein